MMNMNISRKLMVAVATALLVSGCASFTAPTYSPHYEMIDRLKKIEIEKLSVGEVQPRDPNASVNQISLRGASLTSPSGTFASYLENAIRSDLMEMGWYDPTSTTRLDATILKNDIDVSGFSTGHGVMEVYLTISKNGTLTFKKVYVANTRFGSSLLGAVAVPKGQMEYPNLVRALLQKVYGDPAFIEAVKK
jgi:hypothetical protein